MQTLTKPKLPLKHYIDRYSRYAWALGVSVLGCAFVVQNSNNSWVLHLGLLLYGAGCYLAAEARKK